MYDDDYCDEDDDDNDVDDDDDDDDDGGVGGVGGDDDYETQLHYLIHQMWICTLVANTCLITSAKNKRLCALHKIVSEKHNNQ